MSIKTASSVILSITLLAGCASKRVSAPAGDIANAIVTFQADLSKFQQSARDLQSNEAVLAARNYIARDISGGVLEQIETRQALLGGSAFPEMVDILQAQANAHVTSAISPADAPAAPAASPPVAKLGSAASIVKAIAKPPKTHDGLKFLVGFIKKSNEDLAALDKQK